MMLTSEQDRALQECNPSGSAEKGKEFFQRKPAGNRATAFHSSWFFLSCPFLEAKNS